MAIQKLNKIFTKGQVLKSEEMNAISKKIDELVDGVNVNEENIPDVSGFLTETKADGKYQPKGNYALKSEIPDTSQLATKTELSKKLDKTEASSTYATKTELSNKLDTSVYNSEKASFATKTELSAKSDKVSTENVSETTKELQPNKYYVFGEVETLTVTLAAGEENKLAEYMFEFTSGTTPTTITEIAGVEWKGDTIEANKVYQASISRGIGILIGRTKA